MKKTSLVRFEFPDDDRLELAKGNLAMCISAFKTCGGAVVQLAGDPISLSADSVSIPNGMPSEARMAALRRLNGITLSDDDGGGKPSANRMKELRELYGVAR